MKKPLLPLILAMMAALVFSGCELPSKDEVSDLNVNYTPAEIPDSGGKAVFTVAGDLWVVMTYPNETGWYSADKSKGSGPHTVTVTIEKNEETTERSATLTVTGTGGREFPVKITQRGTLETPDAPEDIPALPDEESGIRKILLTEKGAWGAEVVYDDNDPDQNWLEITSSDTGNGAGEITVKAEAFNNSGEPRTARIKVTYDEGDILIPVTQAGISIPDKHFRNKLTEAGYIEVNGDQAVRITEAGLAATDIDASAEVEYVNGNILQPVYHRAYNIDGIEYFPSLKRLWIPGNYNIEGIDLSRNPELEYLDCSRTEITELDLSKNIKLIELVCSNTKLANLDLQYVTSLEKLTCNKTNITELDLSHNPALIKLWCSNNGIGTLDLSHNPALEDLYCGNIPVSELNLAGNPNLLSVDVSSTNISQLNLSNNSKLITLSIYDTPISDISIDNLSDLESLVFPCTDISNVNISGNVKLRILLCYDTKVTSLDLSSQPNIEQVNCENTPVSSLNLPNNPKLYRLVCNNTLISELDVSKCPKISSLSCYDCVNLEKLNLSGGKFSALKLYNTGENDTRGCIVHETENFIDISPKGTGTYAYKTIIMDNIAVWRNGYPGLSMISCDGLRTLETLSIQGTGYAILFIKDNPAINVVYVNGHDSEIRFEANNKPGLIFDDTLQTW